jgi:hypothetical protein
LSLIHKIQSAIKLGFQKLYFTQVNSYEDVIWLIGPGRSGTTWVASLINHDHSYREMFEPIHPILVKEMGFLDLNQYVRPEESYHELLRVIDKVFSGRFTRKRVDKDNPGFVYKKLIVKDIYANLLCYHVVKRFPEINPVLLLRHPFAVAHSVSGKKHWQWQTDPRDFLNQEKLMSDYLEPYRDLINEIGQKDDFIIRQILIWCIINYVPLKQFKQSELYVLYYEDVLENPNDEMGKLRRYLYPNHKQNVLISEDIIDTPSKVSNKNGRSYKDRHWINHLTIEQREKGGRILESFGLDQLYNPDFTPNHEGLKEFMNR